MRIAFILSMPGVGSWNGRWTGAGNLYAKIVNLGEKRAREVLEKGSFYYSFGDGWAAEITVKKPDRKLSADIRHHSKGFCGYDWMIDSIRADLKIVAPSDRRN